MYWPTLLRSGRGSDAAVSDSDPFTTFRREMDRLFETFGRDLGWPPAEGRTIGAAPSIDVSETEGELKIEAELPGLDEKDVELTVTDNVLTIKGEKKSDREQKKKDYHLVERSYGSFSRSLTLPFTPDPDSAKASFANGVLSITLPKPPETTAKAKKIAIGQS